MAKTLKMGAVAKIAEQLATGAYYFAPAGPSSARKGFALYDGQGFYVGETVTVKPTGLTPHTKAIAPLRRRMAEDAPKRRPTR